MALDWELFESEWGAFTKYAFDKESSARKWRAWECERTCDKIRLNMRVLLGKLAGPARGSQPSLMWLCDPMDFDSIIKNHKSHLSDQRGNKPSALAQTMRTFKRPISWALEFLSTVSAADRAAIMDSYQTYCSNLSTTGGHDHCIRSEARKVQECEAAGATWQQVTSNLDSAVSSLLSDFEADPRAFKENQKKCAQLLQLQALELARRAPRGMELFNSHFAPDLAGAEYLRSEDLLPQGGTVIYAADHGGYRLLVPSIKHRANHVDLSPSCSSLMVAIQSCFNLQCGDYIFTPSLHGAHTLPQGACDQFDSARWSNFICSASKQLAGVGLRPREFRRLRATHIASGAAVSPAVVESVAVSMGTSSKQVLNVYNSNSVLQKTQLSRQVELFEGDRRFSGDSQTVVVPVQAAHGGNSFVPARYVRGEGASSALFALFQLSGDTVEMSSNLIRCNPSSVSTNCKLVDEPLTMRQCWRSRSFTTAHAHAKFSVLGTRLQNWVTDSLIDLGTSSRLVLGDIVYLLAECTLGQVKQISPNGESLTVEVATELPEGNSKRTTYQFMGCCGLVGVDASSVVWPIDLQFQSGTATFVLRKSTNLETV